MRYLRLVPAACAALLLAACAPAAIVTHPQTTPAVFATAPEELFQAARTELSRLARQRHRLADRLVVVQADADLGLLRAEHRGRDRVRVFGERRVRKPGLTLAFTFDFPVRPTVSRGELTIIVRPHEQDTAALVYTSLDHRGRAWRGGEEVMARLIERLEQRFERVN